MEFTLLYDWDQISTSFKNEVNKAKTDLFKQLLIDVNKSDTAKGVQKERNRLNGGTVPANSIESGPKSSTEGLQAWLEKTELSENIEPAEKAKLGYELFTVLGIHKAVDEAANGLLVSMNLERWNFVMISLLKTKEEKKDYNFEDKLRETLKAYCKDDYGVDLFLERLVILRQEIGINQLTQLHNKQNPREFLKLMYEDDEQRYDYTNLHIWFSYLEAYNDVYPADRVTLLTALDKPEISWTSRIFGNVQMYPQARSFPRRIINEYLKLWAEADPPISPVGVLIRLGLLPKTKFFPIASLKAVQQYLIYRTAGEQALREDLIKNLLVELNWPHDTTKIRKLDEN